MNNDSERQNEHVALNTKWKMINSSKPQTKNAMALDVEMEKWLRTPNWEWSMALNTKWKMTLDIELKTNNDSVRQTKDSALNAKMTMRLWTPN